MRRVIATVLCLLFLSVGCIHEETDVPTVYSAKTAHYEGEGFRLTYPAEFTLVRETEQMVSFAVKGDSLQFAVTWSENTLGNLPIEKCPAALGVYEGATVIDATSFSVSKHLPNVLSGYFLYEISEEKIFLLEYIYGGEEEQKALSALFEIEVSR